MDVIGVLGCVGLGAAVNKVLKGAADQRDEEIRQRLAAMVDKPLPDTRSEEELDAALNAEIDALLAELDDGATEWAS